MQYNLKLYQLVIKLLTHKDENREIVRAIGDAMINHILASISDLDQTHPEFPEVKKYSNIESMPGV